jgi:transcriptional regulator with XRE-family HTH domain
MIVKMDNFGDTLKRIRNAHGISLRQLGLKYGRLIGKPDGVANSVISNWESGTRTASKAVILLLAEAMKCTDGERNELLVSAGMLPEHRHDITVEGLTVSIYSVSPQITEEEIDSVTKVIQEQLSQPPQ